jgi:hypothetical protein
MYLAYFKMSRTSYNYKQSKLKEYYARKKEIGNIKSQTSHIRTLRARIIVESTAGYKQLSHHL